MSKIKKAIKNVKGVISVGQRHTITGAYLCLVEPNFIVIDQEYQRNLSMQHVDYIRANFWNKAVTCPDISIRNGLLYAMNGNHTNTVAKLEGWKAIDVWIHDMSFQEEARFFAIKNSSTNNKKMSQRQVFITAIKGGDSLYCGIQKLCNEAGYITPFDQDGKRGKADFVCISILVDAYQNKFGSPDRLKNFLKVLNVFKINGRLDKPARKKEFLRGFYDFILSRPDLSNGKIINMIENQNITAGAITSMASERACDADSGRNHFRQVFETLAKKI